MRISDRTVTATGWDLGEILATAWGMHSAQVTPLDGGMNSQTWLVEHQGSTYVAKAVSPAATADLAAGAEAAAKLAEEGFVTGRPVPTRDGRLVLLEPGLALLEHVPGRELNGETDEEQEWMGGLLAGVHSASHPGKGPSTATFFTSWLSVRKPGVEAHAWLVAAIDMVRVETDPLALTWSMLHTDPAPVAFVHDDTTGVTGLIDWAGATRGPVLYDVASAVMYLGGPERAAPFLRAYESRGPLAAHEMEHLGAFRRLREAVQGAYFAERLAVNDLTGGIETAENEKGLNDARRRLGALGIDTT